MDCADIRNWLEAHRDEMVTFLGDLVSIASENPPGNLYPECVARIRQQLDALGIETDAIGPSLVIGAAIFAIGHVVTIRSPARLGVFFPALAFGWLRARTGGIGAGVVFHAYCNIYSEMLGRGYGAY